MVDLAQKIKDLPDASGVYIMLSESGQILYIGKAKVLKNRVRQYFQNSGNKTAKVIAMVSKIADFKYIITNNEVEALVLENNLIKKYKPPYNILLKDDKSYPFIKINLKEKFPRIEIVRKLKQDGAKYFGPFMQGVTTKDILEVIQAGFKIRSCRLDFSRIPKSHRPCLNYHLNKCYAPCVDKISEADYRAEIENVIKFLSGNDKTVEEILTEKMQKSSDKLEFEVALYYKQRLETIDKLVRKQITALPRDLNLDIFSIATNGINTVASFLVVRGGKVLGGDKTTLSDYSLDEGTALANYIMQFYESRSLNADEILLPFEIESQQALQEMLSQEYKKVNVITPHQGIRKQLVDMATNNANDYLEKSLSELERKENLTFGAILQLQELLGLKNLPIRIECFDISHISGTNKVASMAVFTNGEADKRQYRSFKIKTVEGNNDFASMYEVLERRLLKLDDEKFGQKPDLIVVDGGKGQLTYAKEVFDKLSIKNIELISLAERFEEIYTLYDNAPIVLSHNTYALKLLQRLRDEAHRFAISFHQSLRLKGQTVSLLKEIEGIGEAKIKALYKHFKSLQHIKTASVEELCKVEGISKIYATRIYNHFNK